MSDILSQEEIDALFNQFSSGGSAEAILAPVMHEKEARKYDFNNPNKFNKDQLRTLENIFDNYARQISSFLTAYLRISTTIEVFNAQQIMYRDFNVALTTPAVLAMVEFQPLKGTVVVDMSTSIAFAIIDRILGGPGFGLKKLRDFSEIEKILLERVILQMLSYLPEPWENVLAIKPRLEKIETNPQFAQIIAPTEQVALVVLSVKIGASEGTLNICLPHLVMEPVMDKLYTKYWYIQRGDDNQEGYREKLELQLEKTRVPVTALIGKTNIMVHDFINLQVGDIIKLDSYYNSDLNILIGDLLKFHAKPGINRGKNAVQITSLIEREAYQNE